MNRKIYKYLSILVLVLVFINSLTKAQELDFRQLESLQNWQAAKNDALQSGKIIFLDIYATWCGPCKKMDAEVYTDSLVSEYFNTSFINLKMDGETEFGRVLAAQYALTGYPSLYFINSEEILINQLVGYRDSEALINEAKLVQENGKRYIELNLRYISKLLTSSETDEFIGLLVKFSKKNELSVLAAEKIQNYTEADVLNPSNRILVQAVVSSIDSFPASMVLKNAMELKASWGHEDFTQYLSSAFDVTIRKAVETGDSVLMEKVAEEFVPVYMMDNPDRIKEAQLTTRKIYYSETEDWENYIASVEKYYDEYQSGNLRFLYLEAYYIIENQINGAIMLTKAMEWVQRVIAVQPDFESYFLAAIISTYRADNDATLLWMNKAEGVAVSDDEKASLEELKKYLDAQQ